MQQPAKPAPNQTPPASPESGFSRSARRFFRWYRNGSVRLGHGLLRRGLQAAVPRHQIITLRSGMKLQVDMEMVVQHTIYWYDGDMEPQLSWAMREFLPVGGTMVDCGANCGYIGLEARLHKNARVMFIEPHPGLAATVRKNVELNGWNDSCKVVEAAASNVEGTTTLFICKLYDGSHSVLADWWPHKGEPEKVSVPTVTLRKLMADTPGFARVDFLKIDTEGHDIRVLEGLGDALCPEKIPVLYTELGREREAACRLMEARGYVGFTYSRQAGALWLRRAVRRYADGEAVAFFLPADQCPNPGEILWVEKNSPRHKFLAELAARRRIVSE